jgi:hypothetical protein
LQRSAVSCGSLPMREARYFAYEEVCLRSPLSLRETIQGGKMNWGQCVIKCEVCRQVKTPEDLLAGTGSGWPTCRETAQCYAARNVMQADGATLIDVKRRLEGEGVVFLYDCSASKLGSDVDNSFRKLLKEHNGKALDWSRFEVSRNMTFEEAVLDQCVTSWIDPTGKSPKQILLELFLFEQTVALDPAVSESAQALIALGRDEVLAELDQWKKLNRQNGEVSKRVVEGFQWEVVRLKSLLAEVHEDLERADALADCNGTGCDLSNAWATLRKAGLPTKGLQDGGLALIPTR